MQTLMETLPYETGHAGCSEAKIPIYRETKWEITLSRSEL